MKIDIKAPAKVNWHLQVGRKREDGYHGICSIFQKINLCDVLHIEMRETSSSMFILSGLEGLVSKGNSTLDKAFRLWSEKTGRKCSVSVSIKKNIPSQSGLGGGSSDAASLLIALEKLTGNELCRQDMMDIGLDVGSDVPFFLCPYDAAFVTGRGEIITPIEARYDVNGYILVPEREKMSTAQAYAMLDQRKTIPLFRNADDIIGVYKGPVSKWNFVNDFELVNKKGPSGIRTFLTGSGSCRVLLSSDGTSYCKDHIGTDCDGVVPDCIGNFYSKIRFAACKTSDFWA